MKNIYLLKIIYNELRYKVILVIQIHFLNASYIVRLKYTFAKGPINPSICQNGNKSTIVVAYGKIHKRLIYIILRLQETSRRNIYLHARRPL